MNLEPNRTAQTFTADTLREALALVRAEYGPDALIIGQERVGRRVAVHACLDLPIPPQSVDAPEAAAAEGLSRSISGESQRPVTSAQTLRPQAALGGGQGAPSAVAADTLVVGESPATPASENPLAAELTGLGYDGRIQDELGGCSDVDDFRCTLLGRLNYARKPAALLRGRYRFIGVGGAGKTAAIVKILAAWVQNNSPTDVAVISTDNERLAGTESLHLACQALNVHMRECAPGQLEKELGQLLGRSLVLIDSPALSQRETASAVAGVQDIWVCSAIHAGANLLAQFKAVQALRPAALIVNQADQLLEADNLAKLLYEWRLPLMFFGTSPQLPRGLELADPGSAARLMFGIDMRVDIELTV